MCTFPYAGAAPRRNRPDINLWGTVCFHPSVLRKYRPKSGTTSTRWRHAPNWTMTGPLPERGCHWNADTATYEAMQNFSIWNPWEPLGHFKTTISLQQVSRNPLFGNAGARLNLQWPQTVVFVGAPRGNPCLGTPKPHFSEEVIWNSPIWEPWEPWEPFGNRLGTSGRRFFCNKCQGIRCLGTLGPV